LIKTEFLVIEVVNPVDFINFLFRDLEQLLATCAKSIQGLFIDSVGMVLKDNMAHFKDYKEKNSFVHKVTVMLR